MADGGLDDMLVTFPLVGASKAKRFAELARPRDGRRRRGFGRRPAGSRVRSRCRR